ncbi:hypothetical protein CTAYLR_005205 [Chrysophaeum taylorii]|uniref:Major facilitator superfamily (MFS) profile domain-containing protein n=1 Tax=Chrysophaeum taylorii TaxID=2483200 RepID=A0AAD7UC23_9STRA|nr:hypothetical protein CTAYLR_005205 [Chrysophaeum taylorii]
MCPPTVRRRGRESWVPLFKIQVFLACVSFSIIVPSIAPYLARMGAPEYILGVAVAVYSLGEMIGSTYFGRWMTVAMREDPDSGPRRALLAAIAVGFLGSTAYVLADALRGGAIAPSPYGFGPALVVVARLTTGIWTGGKMTIEQTYIGEAAAPERTTEITSEVGVFAVLGFVVGPTIGALFSPVDFGSRVWRVDQYTAPGYFIAIACALMSGATGLAFDPKAGYANPVVLRRQNSSRDLDAYGATEHGKLEEEEEEPDKVGLWTLLACFFAHFYSFAIQETITTPFVAARFGWSQRQIDYLFAGVGLLSLLTSFVVALLAKVCSDVALLVLSLVFGLVGSLALIDQPLGPPLDVVRFLLGFGLITIAFPFGRNVALAMYSKVLGPTPQGSWIGLMFVVGAIPRCLGPSWSLYCLRLACTLFPRPAPCPAGGRTCLEFFISAAFFAACMILVFRVKTALLPFEDRNRS